MTEQELVERLRAYVDDDHERLCAGRNYDCTCGYDERRDPLLAEAADAIERLTARASSAEAQLAEMREALRKIVQREKPMARAALDQSQ